jgi:hypothetical protein
MKNFLIWENTKKNIDSLRHLISKRGAALLVVLPNVGSQTAAVDVIVRMNTWVNLSSKVLKVLDFCDNRQLGYCEGVYVEYNNIKYFIPTNEIDWPRTFAINQDISSKNDIEAAANLLEL